MDCAYFLNSFLNNSKSAFCAFYDLDEESIIRTIEQNNISVKLFEENYEFWMAENIVPVGSRALMHHKFCVVDDYILTGSWNPTKRGTYYNDNYILFIESKSIARNYLDAYNSLENEQEAKALTLNLSGISIENYFCPAHNCEQKVLDELDTAIESIYVLAFSFTSLPIAEKLAEKQKQGVEIIVLFEKTRIASYSQYAYLLENNVSVHKDTNPYTMHEKVFIIDGKVSILGSYNPTAAANTKNDENILIVHDKKVTELFIEEFKHLLNQ
jgi:phosphatidylserine/phosphatidylglycerophosphate/cardiolipin synthase-like enzyme